MLNVPEVERKELEAVLHLTGNLIAISEFCARGMKSPHHASRLFQNHRKNVTFPTALPVSILSNGALGL